MKRTVVLSWVAVGVFVLANPAWTQYRCLPPCAQCPPQNCQNCLPPGMAPPQAPGMQQPGTTPPGEGAGQAPQDTTGQPQQGAEGTQTPESQTDQNQQAETGELGTSASYDGPIFGDIMIPPNQFTTSTTPVVSSLAAQSAATSATQPSAAGHAFGGSGITTAVFPYHNSFKIAENELPKPLDRVWVTYNYYSDVLPGGLAYGSSPASVHREMAGGEKTFLNGNASVGIRVPIFWIYGTRNAVQSQIGDISVVFKYALVNNKRTGDCISAGLVVGVPTGPSLTVPGQSSIHPVELVPWVGEIWHWGRLYNIDFTSLAVPTDARDVTLFFESFALAYLLYRNSDRNHWLNAIVPDLEFHANVPLNHGSLRDVPIGYPTTVDFTGGCYFFLGRSVLGMAAGTPLTGPKPYGVEALVNLNVLF